jgi:inorganic pyrophosphatase
MDLLSVPCFAEKQILHCIVETPRGSTSKFKYDPRRQFFTLSRSLVLGLRYPYDWGFIPSTAGPDGDPLDVMLIHDATTYPGMVLPCRLLGALAVEQRDGNTHGRNDRYFATPLNARRDGELQDIHQLPARALEELETFFKTSVALEPKEIQLRGWLGPIDALEGIEEGRRRFQRTR